MASAGGVDAATSPPVSSATGGGESAAICRGAVGCQRGGLRAQWVWRNAFRAKVGLVRANRHSAFIELGRHFSELDGLFMSRDKLFTSRDTLFVSRDALFSRRCRDSIDRCRVFANHYSRKLGRSCDSIASITHSRDRCAYSGRRCAVKIVRCTYSWHGNSHSLSRYALCSERYTHSALRKFGRI